MGDKCTPIALMLLEHCAKREQYAMERCAQMLTARDGYDGHTPLECAAAHGHTKLTKVLLEPGGTPSFGRLLRRCRGRPCAEIPIAASDDDLEHEHCAICGKHVAVRDALEYGMLALVREQQQAWMKRTGSSESFRDVHQEAFRGSKLVRQKRHARATTRC